MAMTRRDFLRWSGMSALGLGLAAAGLVRAAASRPTRGLETGSGASPDLPLRGSPYRRTSDGLVDYAGASREGIWQDIVHHRMPPAWRDRYLFRI